MSEHGRELAEEARVAAELEREAHEIRRRVAEGGPDQHVTDEERGYHADSEEGRVESEGYRVLAETQREEAEAARTDVRGFYLRVATAIALPLAFIALLPALIGLWMLDNETDERIDQNRMAIERLASIERKEAAEELVEEKDRAIVRARIRRTDVLHCREIEQLKAATRRAALENFAQLDRNGELLGIEITPEVRAATEVNLARTLTRFRARDGGCGTLPSLRPPGTPPSG